MTLFSLIQAAKDVGINSITKKYDSNITEVELLKLVDDLNKDDSVDGILVQLPLPDHINERMVSFIAFHFIRYYVSNS